MAEGEKDFVVLSKVRIGHKREFEFALRSQNEIVAGSLGRTRSRSGPEGVPVRPAKRVKRPVGRPRKKNQSPEVVVAGESEDEPTSDVVDVDGLNDDHEERERIHNPVVVVESRRRESGDERDPVVEDDDMGFDNVTGDDNQKKKEKKNKKMKKKMIPTKLKELLATGLFEGMSVKYVRGLKKAPLDRGLAGIVRGTGILCFCSDCMGAQVVRPNEFEVHAGSSNKRPADYIYLDNGQTFRDVLNACKQADLDSLSATILSSIGSSPIKNPLFCLSCKVTISEAAVGRNSLLCSSCIEKASETTPTKAADGSERCNGPVLLQKSTNSSSKSSSSSITKSQGKITRKDLRLHKLVFQDDFLPDGTEVAYYVRGKKLLSGYKKGFGIFCYCCNTEVSPSQFEAHAGCASRRKPYLNIYTSNGASLHELSLTLSRTRKFSAEENDDLCSVCYDAGDLLCCDGCPRAFHTECLFLPTIPQGKWYCRYCEDMFQKEKFAERNPNAIAAGRVPGVDPVEQITNRCIRIVRSLDTQYGGGCALCRAHDFCNSGFGPRTVLICDQCEKEYHVGCLREHKMQFLKELPVGDWLCSSDCEDVHSTLKKLVENGEQKLPDYLVDIIKKKHEDKCLSVDNLDIRWRVFNRRLSCLDEIRSLLSKAVSVFHEQFDPICYGDYGQDLIPHMVYGRDLKEREFGGMFCAVLSVNSTIVSAGVFRVFGKEVAEIPLVATSKDNEGKGYFQCLYSRIETLLRDMEVKTILLPAAEEARSLWLNRFDFAVMPQKEFDDFRRRYALMIFEGTSMLHKPVPTS